MKYCSNCGKELKEGVKFCSSCGCAAEVETESEQRKTVYDGALHRCPQCGEHLNAFATVCSVCGYELRGVRTTSSVHELALKIEKTDNEDQKRELISNFYIPNTKEDIYEFFILAYSNITADNEGKEAWAVKLEQAYLKAKLAFSNSEEFSVLKELYENLHKNSRRRNFAGTRTKKGLLLWVVGGLVASTSLLLCEILADFSIYMYDALYPIAAMGFMCFFIGLIMYIIPERNKKKNRR